ncbi:hypothetical protein LR48_Vigan477s003300 [Vigna angularis]|uniref:Uncharacterized protein n=1 Tax=Phaseolus angularis TaxID=3914 RepID=A0A0L9TCA9_PHAAN|nr:hypothetical protein LR48_Vigan477s003300 [Vigna angularis]
MWNITVAGPLKQNTRLSYNAETEASKIQIEVVAGRNGDGGQRQGGAWLYASEICRKEEARGGAFRGIWCCLRRGWPSLEETLQIRWSPVETVTAAGGRRRTSRKEELRGGAFGGFWSYLRQGWPSLKETVQIRWSPVETVTVTGGGGGGDGVSSDGSGKWRRQQWHTQSGLVHREEEKIEFEGLSPETGTCRGCRRPWRPAAGRQ